MGVDYQKWITKLMGYNFDIQYFSGASNKVADALSRILERVESAELVVPQWQFWNSLKSELEADEFLKRMRDGIISQNQRHVGFIMEHGVLY